MCFAGILQAQRSQLFANYSIYTRKTGGCYCVFGIFLLILFSCVSVTIQILVCEADLCMETQKTTPCNSHGSQHSCWVRDACSKAYDWDFEVSLHPFSAFRMRNELPITVDMFRHNTSYGRSLLSLHSAGPPTRNPSGLEKGCVGKEEKGERDRSLISSHFPCLCKLWARGQCLSPLFPQQSS